MEFRWRLMTTRHPRVPWYLYTDGAATTRFCCGSRHSSRKRIELINLDLRGHGESGSPEQIYSVAQFADDVAWLCHELDIERAALVGHSMGGAVAIETAYRHPELVQAVGLIDSVFQAPSELMEMLAPLLPGLQGSEYENIYRKIMASLSLPTDLAELTSPIFSNLPRAPQHVLLSALQQHLEQHDFARAAASCSVPIAYIRTARPLANLASLQQLVPNLWIGQTLGAGHFAPWLVPDQVNAMLLRFFQLTSTQVFSEINPVPR